MFTLTDGNMEWRNKTIMRVPDTIPFSSVTTHAEQMSHKTNIVFFTSIIYLSYALLTQEQYLPLIIG